jgi:putative membrane protein
MSALEPGASQPAPDNPTQAIDATRRTRLANERTYLAWWRTGLASLAVGIGAGKVVPLLGHSETKWPYTLAGAGFIGLGVAFIIFGLLRQRDVEQALARGEFAPPDHQLVLVFTLLGAAFGLLLLIVLLATS